jgi:co-chaperonin GroES (HSP10)|tara:strand:- start:220 stop:696 length:477 start_codon:yes stop_codon:yes gene_type:complete
MATTKIIKPEGLSGGRTIITDTQAPLSNPHSNTRQPVPTTPEGVKDYIEILPKPVGYRMLVRPWSGEKKTKGGILLSDTTHEMIEMTTVVGLVIMMGDLCYKDKTKFPNGPWCKEGQFVIYGRYSGARFKTRYGEHRILNDDEVMATIKQPEDVLHLY